jgi:hypothetical protein
MNKWFFVFLFFILCFWASAQDDITFSRISGVVTECKKNVPLSYVHVINETSKLACLADLNGNFTIYAKSGDILKFSYIGFKPAFIDMKIEELNNFQSICLSSDTILLKEVVVLPYSNYNEFKQRFMALKVESKEYAIPGVTLKERTTLHNFDDEKYVKSLGFALSSPISALYYNFSRHQKNIRKYYQFENEKWQQYAIDQKYNREIVGNLTGLKDDKLTVFMAWCNFSKDYLIIASEYDIALKIKEKYILYCDNHECK